MPRILAVSNGLLAHCADGLWTRRSERGHRARFDMRISIAIRRGGGHATTAMLVFLFAQPSPGPSSSDFVLVRAGQVCGDKFASALSTLATSFCPSHAGELPVTVWSVAGLIPGQASFGVHGNDGLK